MKVKTPKEDEDNKRGFEKTDQQRDAFGFGLRGAKELVAESQRCSVVAAHVEEDASVEQQNGRQNLTRIAAFALTRVWEFAAQVRLGETAAHKPTLQHVLHGLRGIHTHDC
eukprot:scaffold8090_cov267-Pinguiococcus_pyrenoidosus.AAC.2